MSMMFITFFLTYFYNAFQLFYSILLGCFIICWCPKLKWTYQPVLFQVDVILVSHISMILLQEVVCPEWFHWEKKISVPYHNIFIIYIKKQEFSVGKFLRSSWYLIYHRQWYTQNYLMTTCSNLYISICTRYHFSCDGSALIFLMNNILYFSLYIYLFSCISDLRYPILVLLCFLHVTTTTSSCSFPYGFSLSVLPYSPNLS